MASSVVSLSVRVRDMERTRLFVFELQELRSRMVIASSPFATDLDRVIDRYVGGGDDEAPTTCGDCGETWPADGLLTHHNDGSHTFTPDQEPTDA